MRRLDQVAWDDFLQMDLDDRAACLMVDGRPGHVLLAQQFEREHLDAIGALATRIRRIAKQKEGMQYLQGLLPHKRAMLYFSQPSSRTFLSFCAACQILGLRIGEVRDSSTSSEYKGESQEDSVRTFSSYFDMIIMRSQIGGLAERMAWALSNTDRPVPIINAGSGQDQHPTQAVLDIYTLQRSFETRGGIDGKTVVFVGDLLRGRTVRSLSALLTEYSDVKQCFVAPDELQVGDDIQAMLKSKGVEFEITAQFKPQVPQADAIYMTRVQDEWDSARGESREIDISEYCFTVEDLQQLKDSAVIMHPFPRRKEVSPDVDGDPRAVYWRQMRNGMWVRAALIATVFGLDQTIAEYDTENA